MTRDDIERFVTRFVETWQRGDVRALGACYAEHASVDSPMLGRLSGRERIEQSFRDLFRVFADWDIEIDALVVDPAGESAALSTTSQATHVGDIFGYPGTRRRFTIATVLMLKFVDGRIASEARVYYFTGLLTQLGVLKTRGRTVGMTGGSDRVA